MKYSTRVTTLMTEIIGEYIVVEKDSLEFDGQPERACGPSAQMKEDAASTNQFSTTLKGMFGTSLGSQNAALQKMNSVISSIQGGTTGRGFGADESAALRSGIVNGAAAGERNATMASQNQMAGLGASLSGGGDSSGLARASGIRQEVAGQIDIAGENNKNNALTSETAADFGQGRANAAESAGLYSSLGGQYGQQAQSEMGGSIKTGEDAFGEDTQIQQMENEKEQAIASGITSAAMIGVTGGAGAMGGGGFAGAMKSIATGGNSLNDG